ncbi:5-methylthioadenosine/S-adenosylhomocysteine deaminase [Natronocella acetinitrilica]|uniref:5-methylthioadenosine/S-adenosylhomocysteine deaminase n=1 Tax=Natronocella acetinitrilica TaxID=414046 RepID=A0AAE3G2V5_9GAMM|nr:TRZ/ATZ family hydrolase [Natronocella acetinitrilica]MCP1674790.1 5-methylthioadenosine/S-adenosylhomocysteine deaminase [Natronocella acetinitrilica]
MEQIDTLINARWVIPVEPEGTALDRHAVAIDRGRIVDILPWEAAAQRFQPETLLERRSHAVLPGLINAHTHAAMNLLRGLADDLPLMTWLQEHIWPAEQQHVGPEFIQDGVEAACAELIAGGVTTFNDMYFFPEVAARVTSQAGLRYSAGMIVIDFPSAYAQDADEYLRKGLAMRDAWRADPLVTTVFAPHAPYTVADDKLKHIAVLAEELEARVHMHIHETAFEVQQSLEQTGKRPLSRLAEAGLVTPSLMAVHMTQLDDDEIALMADSNASVVHCPESNLKLASGFCPVQRLLDAGVNVALGTDGAASNNDLDMFGEMRTAALLAKGVTGDAAALPAERVLAMATINGARALGMDRDTGSLLPGKFADLIAVDLSSLETRPVYHPISQLVYAAGRHHVTDTWVAGRRLYAEGALTTLNRDEILEKLGRWQDRLMTNA